VVARAQIESGHVGVVRFQNVPSFVLTLDATISVPGLGNIRYDIGFGGAFYAFVQAEELGLDLTPQNFRPLIEKGMAIKRAVMDSRPVEHPFEADLSFLYGTIFIGPPQENDAHSRNVCIFAEGEVDRCPTGTGVSARLAIHFARNEIAIHQPIIIESIIGTRFSGQILNTTSFGPYPAVFPEVSGMAHITGRNQFLIDPSDPLKDGFMLR